MPKAKPKAKSSRPKALDDEALKKRAKVVHNTYINVDMLKAEDMQNYFRYLSSPRRILWTNFMSGTAKGLGFVLGTVIILAVATFVVSQILSEIPWIGELFRWTDDWLRENIETYAGSA
tara:strand:- start:745 stop:1101 length:357 start_codon:yes stop_codon:yes gene_type:complete